MILVGRFVVLVDIGADRSGNSSSRSFAHQRGVGGLVLDRRDPVDPGLERSEPRRLNRRLVDEAGIGRADLAGGIGLGRFENLARALLRELLEQGEHSVVGAIGGDFGGRCPGSVGEIVEILAGRDRAVHALHIEAEAADLRAVARLGRDADLLGDRALLRGRGRANRERAHGGKRDGDLCEFHQCISETDW